MENKRKNVYITIFVITTIIASCAAVYFYLKSTNNNLVESTSKNENTIEEENEKDDVNSDNTSKNKDEIVEKSSTLNNNEIKELISDFLNLRAHAWASPEGVLIRLGYYNNYQELFSKIKLENEVYKTEIKYLEFKEKLQKYMSSNLILTDVAFRNYFNFRGNLAIISGGASGGGYTINEVKQISDKNDRLEYEFFGNYEWAQHIIDINGKCIVVIENGKPVIDSFKVDQNVNDKQEL